MKSKTSLLGLLLLGCILFGSAYVFSGNAEVQSVEVSPSDPVQGDSLNIQVKASPGEEIDVSIAFTHTLSVSRGSFKWTMSDVDVSIPLNSFTIIAENTDLLRVTTRILWIPITQSIAGIGGVATISQSPVPAGSYWMEISGDAVSGAKSVQLTITASSRIVTDGDGEYVYQFDTSNVPAGDFTATIGGVTEDIHLSRRVSNSSSAQPSNNAPVAVSSHPTSGIVGEPVLFNASGSYDLDEDISGYSWSFGDGSTFNGENVSHMYSEPGNYTVNLSVVDVHGAVGSTASEITVKINEIPVANAGPDRQVFQNSQVLLDASESFDPDGETLEYTWTVNGSILTGLTTSWIPELPGKYFVTLTVKDEYGGEDLDKSMILVLEEKKAPEIIISSVNAPEIVVTGEPFIVRCTGINIGDIEESFEVNLNQDGVPVDYHIVYLRAGETTEINYTVTLFTKGLYIFSVENQSVNVQVKKTQPKIFIAFINSPDSFIPNNTYNLTFVLKNNGNATLTEGTVLFSVDSEPIQDTVLMDIDPGEMIFVGFIWTPQKFGEHNLLLEVDAVSEVIKGISSMQKQVLVSRNYTRIAASIFVGILLMVAGWKTYTRAHK